MANVKYYTNPAFCQQSEFYSGQNQPQRTLSPQRSKIRQPPVGAQTPMRILESAIPDNQYEEQEFYEEMLVDDTGLIKEKKVLVVSQNIEGKKYIQIPQTEEKNRYEMVETVGSYESPKIPENRRNNKHRYECIPLQEQDKRTLSPAKNTHLDKSIEMIPSRTQKYGFIQNQEQSDSVNQKSSGRYALVPVEQLSNVLTQPNKNRYEYIQNCSPTKLNSSNLYEYIQTSPQKSLSNRYEYIQQPPTEQTNFNHHQIKGNPIATQKLHELLSTPKKSTKLRPLEDPQKAMSPQSQRRVASTVPSPRRPISPIPQTPSKHNRGYPSHAQQQLNYALSTRQVVQDKRHTAIVAPICSSPVQSVYSETTFSKSESWMNLSIHKKSFQAILSLTTFVILVSSAGATGLSFYMFSILGRPYFLQTSVLAGVINFLIGLMGCSRKNYWVPNRNYISGYLLLCLFSLMNSIGLLILLIQHPPPGTPLADITSGAVCGVSVLSLIVAGIGVVSSYCCQVPPPDNRVQHCVQGFTV